MDWQNKKFVFVTCSFNVTVDAVVDICCVHWQWLWLWHYLQASCGCRLVNCLIYMRLIRPSEYPTSPLLTACLPHHQIKRAQEKKRKEETCIHYIKHTLISSCCQICCISCAVPGICLPHPCNLSLAFRSCLNYTNFHYNNFISCEISLWHVFLFVCPFAMHAHSVVFLNWHRNGAQWTTGCWTGSFVVLGTQFLELVFSPHHTWACPMRGCQLAKAFAYGAFLN